MSTLASASQAVLDATYSAYDPRDPIALRRCVAAALRAAAEVVAPISYEDVWTDGRMLQYEKQDPARAELLAIADELEGLCD